jgi:hypothetical protein
MGASGNICANSKSTLSAPPNLIRKSWIKATFTGNLLIGYLIKERFFSAPEIQYFFSAEDSPCGPECILGLGKITLLQPSFLHLIGSEFGANPASPHSSHSHSKAAGSGINSFLTMDFSFFIRQNSFKELRLKFTR